jgi:hypothetical protein
MLLSCTVGPCSSEDRALASGARCKGSSPFRGAMIGLFRNVVAQLVSLRLCNRVTGEGRRNNTDRGMRLLRRYEIGRA